MEWRSKGKTTVDDSAHVVRSGVEVRNKAQRFHEKVSEEITYQEGLPAVGQAAALWPAVVCQSDNDTMCEAKQSSDAMGQ